MDCKAVSNAVVISWYQRQRKVFISFYFWLFWQSVSVAFFTWHNISYNAITITAIIHVRWDAVTKKISTCDSSKTYFSNQSFRSCNFIKKETLVPVLSCEFCKISKNTIFYGKPLVPASGRYNTLCSYVPCSNSESLSKERSSTMGNDKGDLFGKEYRNFITKNRKAKNQAMAVIKPGNHLKQTKRWEAE